MTSEGVIVQIAALTHPGKVRTHNEDSIVVDGWMSQGSMEQPQAFSQTLEEPLLCLVADGMGGHASGEIASRFAARRLSKETHALAVDETSLAEGLHRIHQDLHVEMKRNPQYSGMGTTVAGLIFSQDTVLVFNIGDSRIYQYQDSLFTQLSTDDVPEDTQYGTNTRISHLITQSLGGHSELIGINPHITVQRIKAGRSYLLCSDGLTDMVHTDKVRDNLSNDPAATVSTLFEEALAAGGKDNISIIVAKLL